MRQVIFFCLVLISTARSQQLEIRPAADNSIRITLTPTKGELPFTPALAERKYGNPVISIPKGQSVKKTKVGNLYVEVFSDKIEVSNSKGQTIQQLSFLDDGRLSFSIDDHPVLGMGEGKLARAARAI
jgi:hypothetical protein